MDPSALREDIPALEDAVYLNTGASGPSPRRVVAAATSAHEAHEFEDHGGAGPYQAAFDRFDSARATVAEHLGAGADDVALTTSTTDAVGQVVAALDWEPGDVVVRTDREHGALVLPFQRLEREFDVEVRVVETEEGRIPRDAYREAVEGARLVAFSSIEWLSGRRMPVADLVAEAHDAGAEVLVDAVQSVGQEPVDVEAWGAEYVAAAGHKWLLAPHGAGFLYVDPDAVEGLVPTRLGYRSVVDPAADRYELRDDARRFEVGTAPVAPYAGLEAAVETVEAVGLETIQAHNERLVDRLKAGLPDERLVSPREFESGLVSFEVEDPEATVDRLAEEGIHLRAVPRPETIRASLHAFNTAGDVDALLEAL